MSSGMKSAYEIALERMESQGIDRPDENLPADVRDRAAEIRNEAEARLAELEILHRDRTRGEEEPAVEEEYRLERRRILERRDSKLEALRSPRD